MNNKARAVFVYFFVAFAVAIVLFFINGAKGYSEIYGGEYGSGSGGSGSEDNYVPGKPMSEEDEPLEKNNAISIDATFSWETGDDRCESYDFLEDGAFDNRQIEFLPFTSDNLPSCKLNEQFFKPDENTSFYYCSQIGDWGKSEIPTNLVNGDEDISLGVFTKDNYLFMNGFGRIFRDDKLFGNDVWISGDRDYSSIDICEEPSKDYTQMSGLIEKSFSGNELRLTTTLETCAYGGGRIGLVNFVINYEKEIDADKDGAIDACEFAYPMAGVTIEPNFYEKFNKKKFSPAFNDSKIISYSDVFEKTPVSCVVKFEKEEKDKEFDVFFNVTIQPNSYGENNRLLEFTARKMCYKGQSCAFKLPKPIYPDDLIECKAIVKNPQGYKSSPSNWIEVPSFNIDTGGDCRIYNSIDWTDLIAYKKFVVRIQPTYTSSIGIDKLDKNVNAEVTLEARDAQGKVIYKSTQSKNGKIIWPNEGEYSVWWLKENPFTMFDDGELGKDMLTRIKMAEDTLNFEGFPVIKTQGTLVNCTIRVNKDRSIKESDYRDNIAEINPSKRIWKQVNTYRILPVAIIEQNANYTAANYASAKKTLDTNYAYLLSASPLVPKMTTLMPLRTYNLSYSYKTDVPGVAAKEEYYARIRQKILLQLHNDFIDTGVADFVIGIGMDNYLMPSTMSGVTGPEGSDQHVVLLRYNVVNNFGFKSYTLTHEMAHDLFNAPEGYDTVNDKYVGQAITNSGWCFDYGPAPLCLVYPYKGPRINTWTQPNPKLGGLVFSSDIPETHSNPAYVLTTQLKTGPRFFDIMTNSDPAWINPQNFQGFINSLSSYDHSPFK